MLPSAASPSSSFAKHDIFLNRLSVRTEQLQVPAPAPPPLSAGGGGGASGMRSHWSKPFSADALNTQQALRVGAYEFSVDVRRRRRCT